MILKNNSKDPKSNNVKLLSVIKEAYFYYKNVYLLKLFWLLINWEGGGVWSDMGCASQKQLWSRVLSLPIEFNGNNSHS